MALFTSFKKAIAVALIGISSIAHAGHDTETDQNGVILAGYDVIGYFTEGKPVLGSAKFTAVYNDVIYRFASVENRDLLNINLDVDKAWTENIPKHILEANSEWHMLEEVDANLSLIHI